MHVSGGKWLWQFTFWVLPVIALLTFCLAVAEQRCLRHPMDGTTHTSRSSPEANWDGEQKTTHSCYFYLAVCIFPLFMPYLVPHLIFCILAAFCVFSRVSLQPTCVAIAFPDFQKKFDTQYACISFNRIFAEYFSPHMECIKRFIGLMFWLIVFPTIASSCSLLWQYFGFWEIYCVWRA